MKKTLALFLAIIMVCSIFSGCGNAETSDPTESTNTPVSSETPTEPAVVEELKNTDIYPLEGEHSLTVGLRTSVENADESPFFSIFEKATGIDITYEYYADEQAPMLFAGEELPDILFGDFKIPINKLNEYGDAGVLVNLMDHLDKMPNLARAYAEDPKLFSAVMTSEGAVYCIPSAVFTLTSAGNMVYYRTDMMAEAGWENAPATIDEFTQYLRDLKELNKDDPDFIPFTAYSASHMKYNTQITQALFPAFGDLGEANLTTTADGKTVVLGVATEQYKRYVTYMHSLIEEGLLDPNCFTADGDLMKAFINEGHTGVNSLMVYMSEDCFPSGNLDLSVFTPFTTEYNTTPTWIMPSLYKSTVPGVISSACEDLDAALAWLDSFYSTEDNPLNEEGTIWGLCFWLGEYGELWAWREDGESYDQFFPDGYTNFSTWAGGKTYGTAPYIGYFPKVAYENGTARFKALAVQEKLTPVVREIIRPSELILTDDEQEIYNDAWADIDTYITQMHAAFITGEIDIEAEWDNYINTLNKMGLQDVIDVYQAALDRFNESLS